MMKNGFFHFIKIKNHGTFSSRYFFSISPAQEKIDAIKANPTLQNIKAVQNDRFVVLDHAAFYCGGPRTVEAIETLAAAFYPDLFSA